MIAVETHNLLLETLYDQGIIGVILLSLVALALFASLIIGVRKTTGAHRLLFLTALTIFGSVVLQSLASNDLLNPAIAVYFWISMALPFAACWPIPARNTQEQPPEAEAESIDLLGIGGSRGTPLAGFAGVPSVPNPFPLSQKGLLKMH